jgi:hypothetical protein
LRNLPLVVVSVARGNQPLHFLVSSVLNSSLVRGIQFSGWIWRSTSWLSQQNILNPIISKTLELHLSTRRIDSQTSRKIEKCSSWDAKASIMRSASYIGPS